MLSYKSARHAGTAVLTTKTEVPHNQIIAKLNQMLKLQEVTTLRNENSGSSSTESQL